MVTGVVRGGGRGVGGGVSVGQVSEGAVGSTSAVGGSGVFNGEACDRDAAVTSDEARVGSGGSSGPGWQPTSPISRAMAVNVNTLVRTSRFFMFHLA